MTVLAPVYEIAPRYEDLEWQLSFDWKPIIGDNDVVGQVVAFAIGDFEVSQPSTANGVSSFIVSGGTKDSYAKIGLRATLSNGEKEGVNILAPVRARTD